MRLARERAEKKGTESILEYSNKSQWITEDRTVAEMAGKPGGHSGIKAKGGDRVTGRGSQVRSCRSHGNKQFRQRPPRSWQTPGVLHMVLLILTTLHSFRSHLQMRKRKPRCTGTWTHVHRHAKASGPLKHALSTRATRPLLCLCIQHRHTITVRVQSVGGTKISWRGSGQEKAL